MLQSGQSTAINLCSDFVKFHHEINILKSILYKNSYPRDFVDKCIKQFLERVLTRKVIGSTVPIKDMMITLTFMAKLSLQICTRFNRVMKNKVLHCNFWIVFQTKGKLISFFTFKDKIRVFLRSGIAYKFKRHFKIRMYEHLGVSALTGKRIQGDDDSAIKEHHLLCSHSYGFDDFSILVGNSNDLKVTLMDRPLVNRDLLPLELFDD